MNIDERTIVHEAGHLVVGFEVGTQEDVIAFEGIKPGEGAASFASSDDPEKWMLRSLGGILAEIHVRPDHIDPPLLTAYRHSVVLSPSHPFFKKFDGREKDFLPTAWRDMEMAQESAEELAEQSGRKAVEHLLEGEQQVRGILSRRKSALLNIIEDIKSWSAEPDHDREPMYSAHRARKIFERASE